MNRLNLRGRPPTHFFGRAPAAAGGLNDTKQCPTPTVALCFGTRQSVRGGALEQPPTPPPARPRAIDHTELKRSRSHVGLRSCLGGGRCRPEERHPWQQPLLPAAQLTRTHLHYRGAAGAIMAWAVASGVWSTTQGNLGRGNPSYAAVPVQALSLGLVTGYLRRERHSHHHHCYSHR
jgi:hypothetical protein